ncbi:MAG TPA: hypothetical protein VMU59_14200 [Caulobacteraceae bacterium]|nr:hypothetical protein [Caulobacteraceae bacterium]
MAPATTLRVKEASSALVPVDQVFEIDPREIQVVDRLRPIDSAWGEALGKIMAAEGQQDPCKVCRLPGQAGFRLVTGGHRHHGALTAGLALKVVLVDADALARRAAEISENLWRKGLDPIDRAAFVAELVTIHKVRAGVDPQKDGRAVSAETRWSKALAADAQDATDTMSVAYGWSEQVGDKLGLNARTIRRDLALHRGLRPDLAARLRGLPVASNAGQLRALALLSEADQRAVVEHLVAGAKTVSAALDIIRQRPLPLQGQDKLQSQFAALWSRLSVRSVRAVLADVVVRDPRLPADLRAILAPLAQESADGSQIAELDGIQRLPADPSVDQDAAGEPAAIDVFPRPDARRRGVAKGGAKRAGHTGKPKTSTHGGDHGTVDRTAKALGRDGRPSPSRRGDAE